MPAACVASSASCRRGLAREGKAVRATAAPIDGAHRIAARPVGRRGWSGMCRSCPERRPAPSRTARTFYSGNARIAHGPTARCPTRAPFHFGPPAPAPPPARCGRCAAGRPRARPGCLVSAGAILRVDRRTLPPREPRGGASRRARQPGLGDRGRVRATVEVARGYQIDATRSVSIHTSILPSGLRL